MKSIVIALTLMLAACAHQETKVAQPLAPEYSKWEAFASALQSAKDSTAQVAIAVAFAANGAAPPPTPAPQPQSTVGMIFTAFVQAADVALRYYGIKAGRDVAITQSNNATTQAVASYQAFTNTALGGFASNTAIASQIQAPAANVTMTLSGTGVLGSGSYTGPVTTNRNCNGGTTSGGSGAITGGAGGSAAGGAC